MKVLMFGWEFPPHISGGLGTACHGITKGLQHHGVEVLFVVPKAFGDEDPPLINASEVDVPLDGDTPLPEVAKASRMERAGSKLTIIPVQSGIRPYARETTGSGGIEQWDYHWNDTEILRHDDTVRSWRVRFSGGYGRTLLKEVEAYAAVADQLAHQYVFDVIHAHDWLSFPAGLAAKRRSGKPLVAHVHATEFDRSGEDHLTAEIFDMEKTGMEEADVVITVSHWTKDLLVRRYAIPPQKIRVVHNGIVSQQGDHFSHAVKPAKHLVSFLGRVTHQKGPMFFVEAAAMVLSRFPDTHFVVAGAGDMLPMVIERVAHLRLSGRFHFTGFLRHQQVDEVWRQSDVYVMPSVSEPFGITPLEAMQHGVPVILSAQSGVSEIIDHAIKIDFWDSARVADAICNVLRHRSLAGTLKTNATIEVNDLTWEKSAAKLKQVYHELI
jgi:glycogen synthase